MRPLDWFLVNLPADPTPGDAFGIRQLAARYAEIANVAGEAAVGVRHARNSGASSAWVGDAGDIFREKSERIPGELSQANDSYQLVATALQAWATALDDAQSQADRGLQQARDAHADMVSARAALAAAQVEWTTISAQQLTYQRLEKTFANVPPPPTITMPTPAQLRSVVRSAHLARASIGQANARIADADARMDAARALVMEAKARRDDAEQRTIHQIAEAGDRAVQPSSIWEAIQDSAAWQTIVQVATVVLTIISIVAIFVGGPLVWAIILAATALLIINALLSIAQGKDAWGELALLAIGLIPGGAIAGVTSRILHVAAIGNRVIELQRATRAVRDVIEGAEGFKTVEVRFNAWGMRFTQSTVSYSKRHWLSGERYTFDDLVSSMKSDGWIHDPIDAVRMPDGSFSSIDNTRVLAAREANIDVIANLRDFSEPLSEQAKVRFFGIEGPNVQTWGDVALSRIGRQKLPWPEENPMGTWEPPTVTGRP